MQTHDARSEALAHSEKLGRAFDPSVAYWRGYYARESDGSQPIGTERLRVFGDALNSVGAQGLWLEAGCGIGVMAREFRAAGLQICGVDMSAKLLEEATRVTGLPLVREGQPSPATDHLRRASVDRLPYRDGHFEGAYASSVLEYAASLELALRELNRIVRRGGHLIFNLPNAFSVFRIGHAARHRNHPYYGLVPRWAYWKWEITKMLERSGWQKAKLTYYGAERNAPVVPLFVPENARQALARSPWAASFVLVIAKKG
jgi:ubiquinone/menaquinone biosynthesis C-methylase UbiE